jgi:hypothetical protein
MKTTYLRQRRSTVINKNNQFFFFQKVYFYCFREIQKYISKTHVDIAQNNFPEKLQQLIAPVYTYLQHMLPWRFVCLYLSTTRVAMEICLFIPIYNTCNHGDLFVYTYLQHMLPWRFFKVFIYSIPS